MSCRYHRRTAVNKKGHPKTLVPAHPGNTNAVRYGVYSRRTIEPRAAEIETELLGDFAPTTTQRIAVHEVARCIAILEAIDRDLDERGIVDRRGEARSLLAHRARMSRRLDAWLMKISTSIDRHFDRHDEISSSPPGSGLHPRTHADCAGSRPRVYDVRRPHDGNEEAVRTRSRPSVARVSKSDRRSLGDVACNSQDSTLEGKRKDPRPLGPRTSTGLAAWAKRTSRRIHSFRRLPGSVSAPFSLPPCGGARPPRGFPSGVVAEVELGRTSRCVHSTLGSTLGRHKRGRDRRRRREAAEQLYEIGRDLSGQAIAA